MFNKIFGFRKSADKPTSDVISGLHRISSAINDKGGSLHFTMTTGPDGWTAVCNEFPGIITGGEQSEPSRADVFKNIVDALKTAFDIPNINQVLGSHPVPSPFPIELCYRQELSLA